jgi:outer membrane protein TolC
MRPGRLPVGLILCLVCLSSASEAQTPPANPAPPQPLTLGQAIEYAAEHYPTLRAALEQVGASKANVDLARSAYLPRLDSLWQSNRATANNVFGQVFPQPVIPALSGPVLSSASSDSVWSSAVGALFSWEPVDFGLRRASVAGADAAFARAQASEALTRLELQAAVGAAFLSVLGAQRAVVVAQADLDRRTVLRQTIQTLVDNQLRPGADASRADAEQAAARTRIIQAQQGLALAQITLRRLLGGAPVLTVDGSRLLTDAPSTDRPPATATHPLLQFRHAILLQARSAEAILAKTDRPRLYFLGSVFARGSGAETNAPFDGGSAGLGLDRANWAGGFQVVFPNVFGVSSLRARKTAAAAGTRAEIALGDEAAFLVTAQQQSAAVLMQSARAIAANTPIQLNAARQSEAQARARYDAGLASLTEVADAQNILAQSEVQDELARIDVWRALLADAVAHADLTPFLAIVR